MRSEKNIVVIPMIIPKDKDLDNLVDGNGC